MPIDLPGLLAEDELTELVDADIPRVDLVGKGANGIPRFLIAKQDEASAGLLDPGFVRDLIAKADPEPRRERVTTPSGLTLTGSPADIAAFIHKASERGRDREQSAVTVQGSVTTERDLLNSLQQHQLSKAEQSTKSQNDLADDQFAYIEPGGKKDADGKTTPRSLRHFPINDAAHVRNALARASGSPFGDKAMGKIRAAAKRFGIEVSKEAGVPDTVTKDMDLDDGIDGMDPTVPLADPDGDYPGSDTEPGSPAWEAIDAATACKWTSILARARVAVDMLAEREMLEAASADPGDMDHAMELGDVCCAIDYAISVLAPFAVAEQSEADCGDDAMAMVGKSVLSALEGGILTAIRKSAEDERLPGALAKIEGLGWIRKSGRVLSSVNEAHIREAAGRLNTVLSSLPQAPTADDGQPVAKEKETTVANETAVSGGNIDLTPTIAPVAKDGMPASPEAQAKNTGPVNAGGTTGMGQPRATGPAASLPDDGPQAALPGDAQVPGRQVVKADGEGKTPMMVVYNQAGKLVGIVDPGDITPVANAEADPDDDMDPDGDGTEAAAPAPATDATDMTPAPPAETGTPAGAMPDEDVAKAGQDEITLTQDVLKSIARDAARTALEAQGATHQEVIAKMAADKDELAEELRVVKARLETVENTPAAPKVFTNGAVPPAHQLRGQDQGAAPQQVDVAKALDLKHRMYTADPAEAKAIHDDMNQMAIDQLAAIHRR